MKYFERGQSEEEVRERKREGYNQMQKASKRS